jgi:hypothetical protein
LYLYTGGALVVTNNCTVGDVGKGFVTQNDGSLAVGSALTLGASAGSSGQYNLTGGQLYAAQILRGSGAAQFNFTGGTLGFQQFGSVAQPFDLNQTGGILSVTNTNPATVHGNYANSNAPVTIQLGGNSAALTVSGTASLAGSLQVSFTSGFQPSRGQQFTLLSAAAVTGNFANITLPGVGTNGLGLVVSTTSTSVVANVANFSASLASPTVTSNGTVQFTVTGSGGNYILQTSTNLTNWTSLQTNTPPFVVTLTNVMAGERRFFRALYSN